MQCNIYTCQRCMSSVLAQYRRQTPSPRSCMTYSANIASNECRSRVRPCDLCCPSRCLATIEDAEQALMPILVSQPRNGGEHSSNGDLRVWTMRRNRTKTIAGRNMQKLCSKTLTMDAQARFICCKQMVPSVRYASCSVHGNSERQTILRGQTV